jgi:hypothetical protein
VSSHLFRLQSRESQGSSHYREEGEEWRRKTTSTGGRRRQKPKAEAVQFPSPLVRSAFPLYM